MKYKLEDDLKKEDLILKPFSTFVGAVGVFLLLVYILDDIGVFGSFEFFVFSIDIFIGVVAFILTIIKIFKEKSIFYFLATLTVVVFLLFLFY